MTVGQITSDAAALAVVANADGSSYGLIVHGAPADVAANLAALSGNSHVATILVSDTAANVSANLDALNLVVPPMSITLTDGATSPLTLSVEQVLSDTRALNDISDYTIAITDTAATVAANIAALNGDLHVTSIAISDTAANIAASLDARWRACRSCRRSR